MAEVNGEQAQSVTDSGDQAVAGNEPLSAAVKNLVEGAVDEAHAASSEQSVSFIEIEEEPVADGKHPLQSTTYFAASSFASLAGATLNAARALTIGAVNKGISSAGAAERLVKTTVNYVREEDVIDRSKDLLGNAESEGRQAVESVSGVLIDLLGKG